MRIDGNARFAGGASLHCDLLGEMKATAEKQTPFACVLGCIDSRAAPELVFDQQVGDVFVGRVAGNLPTAEILGSFEYATKVAGAKAIVVLGHNHCGAVKGAIDKADVGANLTTLLNEIEPAVAVLDAMRFDMADLAPQGTYPKLTGLSARLSALPARSLLSLGIGVALLPDHAEDATELMQRADTAMYAAKDAGRNAYRP